MNFGMAFSGLKNTTHTYMRLPQWKHDVKIRMQVPDNNSKMNAPYLYVESLFGMVPWMPTQIELFSNEWEIIV